MSKYGKGLANTTSIQGLEAFFRADNVTTDGVSPWKDLSNSVSVHDFSQSVSANKPALIEQDSDFLNQGSVSFDGANDYLTAANHADFELSGGLTIYVVGKFANISGTCLASKAGAVATTMSWAMEQSAGSLSSVIRNAANTAYYSVTDGNVTMDGAAHIFKFSFDPGTLTLEAKTDTNAPTTLVVADYLGSSVSDVNLASRISTGSLWATGSYARVLVYDNVVSAGDNTNIITELNALYRGVGSSTGFDFSAVTGLVLDLSGNQGVQYDVLTCPDLTGNGYDLTWSDSKFSSIVSSKFKTRALYSQEGVASKLLSGFAIDAPPGKKLSIYAVIALESPKADADATIAHLCESSTATTGWICTVQKTGMGDHLYTSVYNGVGTAESSATTDDAASWAPGLAQVVRYEIDGNAVHHEMYSGGNPSDLDWSTAGHNSSAGSLFVGHNSAALAPTGAIAALAFFVNDGITDAQHREIVDELTREFLTPFDPITQVSTLAAYWRAAASTQTTGIALWRDVSESANVHNATQATDKKMPTVVFADPVFDGHNSLAFDGTTDYMVIPDHADLQLGGGLTLYLVVQTAGTTTQIMWAKHQGTGTAFEYSVYLTAAGKLATTIRNAADTAIYSLVSSAIVNDGIPRVLEFRYDGATVYLTVNGVVAGSLAVPDFFLSGQSVGLGDYNNGTGTLFFNGKMARVLAYDNDLAAPDRTSINNELMGLYGISGSSTGFDFSSVAGLTLDLNGDTGTSPAVVTMTEPVAGHTLTDGGNRSWYYNAYSPLFKGPTIESLGHGKLDTALNDYLEPDTGGRMITYVAFRPILPAGETSGKVRVVIQQAVSSSGYFNRTQYISANGTHPINYQYDSSGTIKLDLGSYDLINGVPSVARFQIDDTGSEILAVVDNGDHVPSAATGYTPTTAGSVLHLGSPSANTTVVGEVAGILVFKTSDRIPWGVHKAITKWLYDEFFADVELSSLSGSVLHLAGNTITDTEGVNTWTDNRSTHHATQTTGTNKPARIMQDPDFNLSGSIWFDGINDVLSIPDHVDLRAGTGFTDYIVVNIPTPPPGARTLISKGSTQGWMLNVESTGLLTAYLRNAADTAWVTAANTINVCDGTTRIVRIMWDGTKLYCRGVDEGSTAAPDAFAADTGILGIGDLASGGQPLSCRVGAVYHVNRAVSTYEDARLTEILEAAYVSTYNSFTPRQITSCVLDLDGDVGIELATGVATWKDISLGVAHNFVQATATNQPAYTVRDSTFYRHGTVQGDGTSDELSTTSHTDFDPGVGFEQWWVVSFPATAVLRTLFTRDSSFILQEEASGAITAMLRNNPDTAYVSVTTVGTYDDGVPRIVRTKWDGATLYLTVGTETVSVAAPDARAAVVTTYLLSQFGVNYSDAKTSHVLHFNAPLSAANADQVNTYLSDKYRVTKAAI